MKQGIKVEIHKHPTTRKVSGARIFVLEGDRLVKHASMTSAEGFTPMELQHFIGEAIKHAADKP